MTRLSFRCDSNSSRSIIPSRNTLAWQTSVAWTFCRTRRKYCVCWVRFELHVKLYHIVQLEEPPDMHKDINEIQSRIKMHSKLVMWIHLSIWKQINNRHKYISYTLYFRYIFTCNSDFCTHISVSIIFAHNSRVIPHWVVHFGEIICDVFLNRVYTISLYLNNSKHIID